MSLALQRSDELAAGLLAAAVHGFFVLLLIFGLSWQIHDPQPVMADLWQSLPEPQRSAPVQVRRPLPQPEPAAMPDNKEAEIALEKKKQEELKRKQEAEAEKKRKEEEARKKEELARQAAERKLVEEKRLALQREEAEMQRLIQEQATAAAASRIKAQAAAAQRASEVASLVARYKDMISAKIRGNTRLPSNLPGNPEVEFNVSVLPTGEIVKITLGKSSGIVAYDEAVKLGIEKSSPLPLPTDKDAAAQFRSLNIKHKAHE